MTVKWNGSLNVNGHFGDAPRDGAPVELLGIAEGSILGLNLDHLGVADTNLLELSVGHAAAVLGLEG